MMNLFILSLQINFAYSAIYEIKMQVVSDCEPNFTLLADNGFNGNFHESSKEEKLFLCYRNTPKHEHELAITGLALFQSLNGCNKHESSDTWNHISWMDDLDGNFQSKTGMTSIYLCFKKENSKQAIDELKALSKKEYYKEYTLVGCESSALNGNFNQGSDKKQIFLFMRYINRENDISSWNEKMKNLADTIKERDNQIQGLEENVKNLLETQAKKISEIEENKKEYENALAIKNNVIEELGKQYYLIVDQIEKRIIQNYLTTFIGIFAFFIIIIIVIGYIIQKSVKGGSKSTGVVVSQKIQ